MRHFLIQRKGVLAPPLLVSAEDLSAACAQAGIPPTEALVKDVTRQTVQPHQIVDRCPCCPRAEEYNGFGSDGPRLFVCPQNCSCHD